MKKENGFWIDPNNNKWNCDTHTKKQAQEKSKTMVRCSSCSRCSRCSNCSNCSNSNIAKVKQYWNL